jgi:hypothetical protein
MKAMLRVWGHSDTIWKQFLKINFYYRGFITVFFKLVFPMVFNLKAFRKNEEIYVLDPKPS